MDESKYDCLYGTEGGTRGPLMIGTLALIGVYVIGLLCAGLFCMFIFWIGRTL